MSRLARVITAIIVGRKGFYQASETWKINKRERESRWTLTSGTLVENPVSLSLSVRNSILKDPDILLGSLAYPTCSAFLRTEK